MKPALRQLADLASAQREVVTRAQARACGLTPSALSRAIDTGVLVAVGPHTMRFAGAHLTWRGSLMAGLLDLGPHAVVTGASAAALHRLDGFSEGPLEFLVSREKRGRRTVGIVHSGEALGTIDRAEVDGIACVSAARAVIDAAAGADLRSVEAAVESGIRTGLFTASFLERRLAALPPTTTGAARVRRVLAEGAVESWLERRFLRLVRSARLPEPALQRVYRGDGTFARVDFDFDPWPVLVEVGGKRGYLSPGERQRKERRRNDLQLQGKVVYFFATEDVRDEPSYVLATMGAALRRAA